MKNKMLLIYDLPSYFKVIFKNRGWIIVKIRQEVVKFEFSRPFVLNDMLKKV